MRRYVNFHVCAMLGFKFKPININFLIWSFLVISSFSILIILQIWNYELEEVQEITSFQYILHDIYNILAFPMYWLYEYLLSKNHIGGSVLLYFLCFLLNSLIYAFLLERTVSFYFRIFETSKSGNS